MFNALPQNGEKRTPVVLKFFLAFEMVRWSERASENHRKPWVKLFGTDLGTDQWVSQCVQSWKFKDRLLVFAPSCALQVKSL